MEHFTAVPVDADGEKFRAIFASGGEPDLAAPDHGRRPTHIVNRRFPDDVVRLAPVQGQLLASGMAVAFRAAQFGPDVRRVRGRAAEVQRECSKQAKKQANIWAWGTRCHVWSYVLGIKVLAALLYAAAGCCPTLFCPARATKKI